MPRHQITEVLQHFEKMKAVGTRRKPSERYLKLLGQKDTEILIEVCMCERVRGFAKFLQGFEKRS